MAPRKTPGKISRRAAVAMLGSGAVLGAIPAAAQPKGSSQVYPVECAGDAQVADYQYTAGGRTRLAMIASACCGESRTAVLAGVETPGRAPTPNTKRHLKRLTDRLGSDNLDEYCFMIWGLSEADVKALRSLVAERMNLQVRTVK